MSMLATICGPLVLTFGLVGPDAERDGYCPGSIARAEAREMLREADENGDGKLDLDELTVLVLREEEDDEGYDEDEDEDEDDMSAPPSGAF